MYSRARLTCKTRKEFRIQGSSFPHQIFCRSLSRLFESVLLSFWMHQPNRRCTQCTQHHLSHQCSSGEGLSVFSASSAKEQRGLQVACHASGYDFQTQFWCPNWN